MDLKKKISEKLENQSIFINELNEKTEEPLKKSQKKVISETKPQKLATSNAKKIFASKILKFEFRDQNFYEKLNKFMNAKESISPEKSVNSSNTLKPKSIQKPKKGPEKLNNEFPASLEDPTSKTIHKKSTTPLMRKKFIQKSSTTKYSKAHNVLN